MDLTIQFDCLLRGDQAACGIVLIDNRSARSVHEAGYFLGDQRSGQAAALNALLRALQLAIPMNPQSVDLRCANELLVRQITGQAAMGADGEMDLYQHAMTTLLKLDNWRIGLIEPTDNRRATELAQRAFSEAGEVTDLHADDAPKLHQRRHTGVPQWTVELTEEPGEDCPARCTAGKRYPFGPDTPAEFCVHATLVALTDGPMTWTDPAQQRMTTVCPHCDRPMRIELVR